MDGYGYEAEESIYRIILPKVAPLEKPPMYRSAHRGTIPPSASTLGHAQTTHPLVTNLSGIADDKVVPNQGHHTMGKPPGYYQPTPDKFLKMNKSNSVPTLARVKKEQPQLLKPLKLKSKSKPSIPKTEDMPVMNLVTSKNFIVANAVETILAAPKKTAQGAKDYLHKEDYGKVPKYLQHIKKDIAAEYEYIRQLQAQEEDMRNDSSRLLSEEEKQSLIMGLKAKWEAVNTDYQGQTHLLKLDTMGKIKRKEKYEAELSQIEKDIEKLNRKQIYIDMHS